MNTKNRFIEYLKIKGIGQTAFESSAGLSRGVISQKSGFNASSIEKIANACEDLNLDWLITGKGEMLKADSYHNNDSGIVSEDNIKLNISMNEKDKMISILLEKIENLESENAELRLKLNSSEESLAV